MVLSFQEFIESNSNLQRIPIENIYVMHWNVNPRNNKTLDWHRQNVLQDKYPSGRTGTGNEEEFGAWYRLVDDWDEDNNLIVNSLRKENPNFPKVFLDDGTHRAIIAFEKNQKYLDVIITN